MNKNYSYARIRNSIWFKIIFWGTVICLGLILIAQISEIITVIIFK